MINGTQWKQNQTINLVDFQNNDYLNSIENLRVISSQRGKCNWNEISVYPLYFLNTLSLRLTHITTYVMLLLIPAEPTVKLLEHRATLYCKLDVLMAEKDKMNLIFEISGSDALHKFEAGRSPTLYYQSENKTVSEVSVKNCLLYWLLSINTQMHMVELLFLLFLALHKINNCMN